MPRQANFVVIVWAIFRLVGVLTVMWVRSVGAGGYCNYNNMLEKEI